MKRLMLYISLAAIGASLCSCASVGRSFHHRSLTQLTLGKTTRQEAITLIGEPLKTTRIVNEDGDFGILAYRYTKKDTSGSSEARSLNIEIKDGFLNGYTYISTFAEDVTSYDFGAFGSLEIGSSTREDALKALGKPTGQALCPSQLLQSGCEGFFEVWVWQSLLVGPEDELCAKSVMISFDQDAVVSDIEAIERETTERLVADVGHHSVNVPPSLTISLDGKRVAYGGRGSKKWHEAYHRRLAVVDGKEGTEYDHIAEGTLIFSPDSKHLAYVAQLDGQQFAVIDGKEERSYDHIGDTGLVFSLNSDHLAYAAEVDDEWFVVIDGKEEKRYDEVGGPVLSPDGDHFAYAAQLDDEWFVVIDGKEERRYEVAAGLIFSPDGKHLAYVAELDDQQFAVIDGKEEKRYDGVYGLIFSPDSKHLVYLVSLDDERFVVLDGKDQKRYARVGSPIFSPDSQHLAYAAELDDQQFVVIDGKEEKRYDGVGVPVFSPDSQHLACTASIDDEWFVVLDGKNQKRYAGIGGSPIFSPDSQHLAYLAVLDDQQFVVIDEKEERRYDLAGKAVFSPDSQHLAYAAVPDDKLFVVIDGEEGKRYEYMLHGGTIIFDSPHSLHYLIYQDKKIYFVRETIK